MLYLGVDDEFWYKRIAINKRVIATKARIKLCLLVMRKIHSNRFFNVHILCSGTNKSTFTFIPGGPGMTAKCFEKFAIEYLADYRVLSFCPTGLQTSKMSLWSKDLETALNTFPTDIVIGHSFGGMLALSSKKLPKLAKGLVLLNSAPDMTWARNLNKFKLTRAQIEKMNIATEKYTKHKSRKNLQRLWASWTPYYFLKRNWNLGHDWLLNQDYLEEAYESSPNLLRKYKVLKPLKIQTLVLTGSKDKLTPIGGFKNNNFLKCNYVQFEQIPNCAHFPWIENPKALASGLLSFNSKIKGGA